MNCSMMKMMIVGVVVIVHSHLLPRRAGHELGVLHPNQILVPFCGPRTRFNKSAAKTQNLIYSQPDCELVLEPWFFRPLLQSKLLQI